MAFITALIQRFVLVIAFSIVTKAEPITYTFTTVGSGNFGNTAFTDANVTVAVYADTADVQLNDSGIYSVNGPAIVQVTGVGYAIFSGGRTVYASDSAISAQDIFTVTTTNYANYDLKTNATRKYFYTGTSSSGAPTASDVGDIVIHHTNPISFDAQLGPNSAPQILADLQSMSAVEGASPVFNPSVQGAKPFRVQWRKNGTDIPGANFLRLTITNATVADSGSYDVVISNLFGKAQSQSAIVTVSSSLPVITTQPRSQSVVFGSSVTFQAAAVGTPPISWKWYCNDTLLDGESASSLARTNVDASMLGTYYAEASNSLGATRADPATLERSLIIPWGLSPGLIPARSEEIISITGGDRHFVALRANGHVEGWGDDERSQASPPADLSDVVSIGAGSAHSAAAQSDGQVRMWGQLFSLVTDVSPAAKNDAAMVAIGVGAQHGVALKKDGHLVDWGATDVDVLPLSAVANASNIVSVAAGAHHTLALRADGTVMAWGGPYAYPSSTNIPSSATGVVAIAVGWFGNAALRADGKLLTWGGDFSQSLTGSNYVDIACGARHTIALTRTGQVTSRGSTDYKLNVVPASTTNAAAVASGAYTAFALMGSGVPVFNTVAIDRNVDVAQNAYFRMWAVGAQPITYQWKFNGTPIQDATNSVLIVTNVQPANSSLYTVTASNGSGQTTSKAMGLNLPPIHLASFEKTAGGLNINVIVTTGEKYRLEFKTDLSNTDWNFVQDIDAATDSINFLDPIPDSTNAHFYRIRRL